LSSSCGLVASFQPWATGTRKRPTIWYRCFEICWQSVIRPHPKRSHEVTVPRHENSRQNSFQICIRDASTHEKGETRQPKLETTNATAHTYRHEDVSKWKDARAQASEHNRHRSLQPQLLLCLHQLCTQSTRLDARVLHFSLQLLHLIRVRG